MNSNILNSYEYHLKVIQSVCEYIYNIEEADAKWIVEQ